jgi:hypothetical protein
MRRKTSQGLDANAGEATAREARQGQSTKKSGRRSFVLAVGGVVGLSIAGWVTHDRLIGRRRRGNPSDATSSPRPRLRKDVAIVRNGDHMELEQRKQGAASQVVGRLNRPGSVIVEQLDGEHTIEELARHLLTVVGHPSQSPESAKGTVAAFVGELAAAGLLATPFYATVERAEFTA